MRKFTYPLFMFIMLVLITMIGTYIMNEVNAVPAWDGQYTCAPGTTYTVEVCQ